MNVQSSHNIHGDLGCVIAVRNRSIDSVRRTLESYTWQSLRPIDSVLVDYGSTNFYRSSYADLAHEFRWRMYSVLNASELWSSASAYNIAVSLLASQVSTVFKNDAEIMLPPDTLTLAHKGGQNQLCIFDCVTTQEGDALPDKLTAPKLIQLANEKCVRMDGEGIHSFPRKWFETIGGYDRRYQGWGYEDSDLRYRAENSIGVARCHDLEVVHQWHESSRDAVRILDNREIYEETKRNFELFRNGGKLCAPDVSCICMVVNDGLQPK